MALEAKDYCEDIYDEVAFYNEILERVIKNPKFYLDNLDERNVLQTYKFSFINYHSKKLKK